MRFAVETRGTVGAIDESLDAVALETIFDQVAEKLAELHDLEADVSVNVDTAKMEFFIVVEAPDTRSAFAIAYDLQDRALAAAEVGVQWNVEAHARPADLVPA